MKITYRWHYFIIAVLLGIIIGLSADRFFPKQELSRPCGQSSEMRKFHKERMIERLSSQLNLTDDQREKMKVIFEAQKPKMKALGEEMRPKFEALRAETHAEIKKILTPEQQTQFDKVAAQMEARMRAGHGGFGGGRPDHGEDFPPPPPPSNENQ